MKRSGRTAGVLLILAAAAFLWYRFGMMDGMVLPDWAAETEISGMMLPAMGFITGAATAIAGAALKLWPLLLIAAGTAVIFRSGTVSRVVWIVVIVMIGSYAVMGYVAPASVPNWSNWLSRFAGTGDMAIWPHQENGEEAPATTFSYSKTIKYEPDMQRGEANISLGACSMLLAGTDDKAAVVQSSIDGISPDWGTDGDLFRLNISERDIASGLVDMKRITHIYLSERILWHIGIVTGASGTRMDLRDIPVAALDIEAGAGTVEAHLGDRTDRMEIQVEGGATDIGFYVPKDTGIRIEKISGLSGENFEAAGLTEIADGIFETMDYEDAEKRIVIRLSTGISNVRLVRE